MPSTALRRPLPALVFLVALTLLTALVWWRVLSRGSAHEPKSSGCTTSSSAPAGTKTLPAPSSVTVWVLNATHRAGIAADVTTALQGDGFQTLKAHNDTKARIGKVPGVAEIGYTAGHLDAAKLLTYYFPGSKLLPVRAGSDATIRVSLGAAYRHVATATQVRAAMLKDKVTVPTTAASSSSASSTSC